MKKSPWLFLVFIASFATQIIADTLEQNVLKQLAERLPRLPVDSISKTPLPGIYEITFGTRVIYVDQNVRYLLNGELLDLQTGESATKERTKNLKAAKLRRLDEKSMIIYGDPDAEHTVTIFTDIECGYCRKLHQEMADYLEQDIRIRYLAYPRAGLTSSAARIAESVWCSDNPNQAMTTAKQGGQPEPKTCDDNPIAAHYQLGQQFGISGTPALVFDNGEILPGYVPAKQLKQVLQQQQY